MCKQRARIKFNFVNLKPIEFDIMQFFSRTKIGSYSKTLLLPGSGVHYLNAPASKIHIYNSSFILKQ